mgnify:CR=1 FL=1
MAWPRLEQPAYSGPLDLLLYSESEIQQRQQFRSAVTTVAYRDGILLYG